MTKASKSKGSRSNIKAKHYVFIVGGIAGILAIY